MTEISTTSPDTRRYSSIPARHGCTKNIQTGAQSQDDLIAAIMIHRCPGNKGRVPRSAARQTHDFAANSVIKLPLGIRSRLSSMRECLGPGSRSRLRTFTILVSFPEPTRYVQCDIVHDPEQPEGERDIVSPRIDQRLGRQKDAAQRIPS
jgi:hypothetical protein